jgi:hypothetical protein
MANEVAWDSDRGTCGRYALEVTADERDQLLFELYDRGLCRDGLSLNDAAEFKGLLAEMIGGGFKCDALTLNDAADLRQLLESAIDLYTVQAHKPIMAAIG